jgi:adenine-specific DNA-methyltransferase
MTDRDHIDSTSPDQRDELIARLKDIAPEAFTDGAINLDRLAELVGLPVENGPERYGLTWPGTTRLMTTFCAISRKLSK